MVEKEYKKPTTEFVYVSGMVKWFRCGQPDEWNAWSHILYPDAAGLETIRLLQSQGMKNRLNHDDDGWWVRLKRPASKEIRPGTPMARVIHFEPPEIIGVDGEPVDRHTYIVGNGSTVTDKLEVYSHNTPGGGKAKAARWLGTKVINLIPYERKDFTEDQERAVKGLDEQTGPQYNW